MVVVLGLLGREGRSYPFNTHPVLRYSPRTRSASKLHLPRKLTEDGSGPFGDERPGDLCCFKLWGNLALFYADYKWDGLIRLGRFDNNVRGLRRDREDCSEKYLVNVDVVRLVHREGNRPGKRVGSDGDLAGEVLRPGLDVFLADVFEEFGADCAGRDDGRPDVVGTSLRRPSDNARTANFVAQ